MLRGLPASSLHNVSILHYADDTIIFGGYDIMEAAVLKWILFVNFHKSYDIICCFEIWSGLSINFHKSLMVHLGRSKICRTYH